VFENNQICHPVCDSKRVADLTHSAMARCWRSGMRRKKPDMVMALMVVFALGVLATGYAQALSGS
jgi:hypothetical protein